MSRRNLLTLALGLAFLASSLHADPIRCSQTQGATRGFLIVRTEEGKVIAHGELTQVAHADRVTTHLVYRFLDGSIDDDILSFTQRGAFRLIRDHHIQRGPYFPKPSDYLVDVPAGTVTSRSVDKDGKEKVEVEHMDIPPDTYNGMVGIVLLNSRPNAPLFKIHMVAPSGKGRMVQLAVSPAGEGAVSIVGLSHTANIFRVHIDLGGVAGVVAPIVGKQPADTYVWVLPGTSPSLLREVGQLYNEGPIVSIEVAGNNFPHPESAKH